MLRLDHVMYVAHDLEAAARRIRFDVGLDSYPGGEHTGLGTGNRILPLGDEQYVELMAVIDRSAASQHPVGRRVLEWEEGLHAWCLSTEDIDAVASRLALPVTPMSRVRPDGTTLDWRLVGVEEALSDPSLPFFIQWDIDADLHPSRTPVEHTVEATGIAWLEVGGDPDRIARRTDGADLPVRVVDADEGPRALAVSTTGGEVVLR